MWVRDNFRKGVFKNKTAQEVFNNALKAYKPCEKLAASIQSDLARTADTMVALSLTKKLSRTRLDYVKLFKSIKVVEHLINSRQDRPALSAIKEILETPVHMPAFTGALYFESAVEAYKLNNSQKANCDCTDSPIVKPNKKCVSTLAYVADLMVLRDDLVGYEGADLAYIETVMLGQKRERVHRHLERSETYSEDETTNTRSEENDLTTNDQFSMQEQSDKVIESDLSVEAGVTAKTWGPGYDVSGTVNGAYQSSKSESSRIAREKSIEITERSILNIQKTTREFISKRKILETEEINTHTFNNKVGSGGVKHINGMYQFVNARYKNQLINYDARLIVDVTLPHPMKIHIEMMSQQAKAHGLTKPVLPDFDISDISDQTTSEYYYLTLAKTYGISQLPKPPLGSKYLSFEITNDIAIAKADTGTGDIAGAEKITIGTVPDGYVTRDISVTLTPIGNYSETPGVGPWARLYVGSVHVNSLANIHITEGETIQGSLLYSSTVAVSGAGYVTCDRLESTYEAWQLEVYGQIMTKYESDLQSYNAKVASWEAQQAQKTQFGKSAFENRMEEEKQLKRQLISYLTCQFYDQFSAMKDKVEPCGRPQMDLELAKKEGAYTAFFERVCDWPLMTYICHPEYWGGWCHEKESKSIDTGDKLHDQVLAAASVRVQAPIKKGCEALFNHYLTTGEIWMGQNELPTPDDEYYISVAQEIKELNHFNTDRPDDLSVTHGSNTVILTFPEDEIEYWNSASNEENTTTKEADINREIMIEGSTYRIVAITRDADDPTHRTWNIELDQDYAGESSAHVFWSTGGLYMGGPYYTDVPQNLVYLRNMKDENGNYITSDCLPTYPQPPCE